MEETLSVDITPVPKKKARAKTTVGKKAVTDLSDHVEIRSKDLPYFLGCWVRFYSLDDGEFYSGGNVREIDVSHVVLQAPFQREDIVVPYRSHKFYCSPTLPQYHAVMRIRRELDQLKYQRQKLKREGLSFPSKQKNDHDTKDEHDQKTTRAGAAHVI